MAYAPPTKLKGRALADFLETLRQDAIAKRLSGIAGGTKIFWSAKDAARIHSHAAGLKPETLVARDISRAPKPVDMTTIRGVTVRKPGPGDTSFLWVISAEQTDLMGDVVSVAGIDTTGFNRNPAVLEAHDVASTPIATSSAPSISGSLMTAVATFRPELSRNSSRVLDAVRGGLIRGGSIGFKPVSWGFSKDPARQPFGVDFKEIVLLEWSVVSVPANQSCLLVGAVGSKSATRAPRDITDIPGPLLEDGAQEWVCGASAALPMDTSDDAYNAAEAKNALLNWCSATDGTISDQAAQFFLAHDPAAPLKAESYLYPFAKVSSGICLASKTGWRQSFAALERSSVPGLPIIEARAVVDEYERRLGGLKAAARLRDARALITEASKISASPDDARARRVAEAKKLRRTALGR
jgi:hypothetical protein